ncbi:hypothetical protein F5Y12DRAFT_314622 [Xylaria sp. FL1777]|nr:hypothetical protein F5Y12DRAFT_314622 [Xylaria sp. FL1777]
MLPTCSVPILCISGVLCSAMYRCGPLGGLSWLARGRESHGQPEQTRPGPWSSSETAPDAPDAPDATRYTTYYSTHIRFGFLLTDSPLPHTSLANLFQIRVLLFPWGNTSFDLSIPFLLHLSNFLGGCIGFETLMF